MDGTLKRGNDRTQRKTGTHYILMRLRTVYYRVLYQEQVIPEGLRDGTVGVLTNRARVTHKHINTGAPP